MGTAQPTAREASLLMGAAMAVTIIGIFLGIFLIFLNIDLAIRAAAALLVGIVGLISYLRHSVYYESDQVRMGWHQDHPEFQLEVGYANLTLGIWALVAAAAGWVLVCAVMLASYGSYLLCALLLHLSKARAQDGQHDPALRSRAVKSAASTGFFVLVLFVFALIAFARAGVLPFVQL